MPPRRKQVTYSARPNHAARSAHARGERQFRTYDTSMIRPKKSKVPVIFACVLAVIVIGGLSWGVMTLMKGCTPQAQELLAEGESVQVTVAEGSGAAEIGKQLEKARLVTSAADFTKRVGELGANSALKAGTYTFTGGTSLDSIIGQLKAGPVATGAALTIPEGTTLAATADLVASATGGRVTAEAFIAAASDASVYAADFPFLESAGTNSLEGFLFPKTYAIKDEDTADSIVRTLLAQFQKETASLDWSYPESQGLSLYEAVNLASIVERESDANTRAKVAMVFYNRLTTEGDPSYGFLQSDATTAYEVGHDPTPEEVHAETPYSTYSNQGLPPTPICSPGLDCLQAVCAPDQEAANYYFFYFEPDGNGGMNYYFTETYEEHQSTFS